MTDGVGIVLQARMGSVRLPGKVLAEIGKRSVLGHCLARLRASGLPVIVATTSLAADDAVEAEAREYGAEVFRGAEDDVLSRFIATAEAFGLQEIVRATADNPAVDYDAPARVLEIRRRVRADHVVECGLPYGAAVEVVTADALARSSELAIDPYDREHVTSYLRRDPRFLAMRAVGPGHLRRPGLRLTVDTPEDLDFMRTVLTPARASVAGATPALLPLADVIAAAEELLISNLRARVSRKGA